MPDEAARLADREAHGAVPELQGGLGLRSRARRAELRVLRLAGARRLQGDQGADPAAEPAAVQGRRVAGARADPPLVREQVARAGRAEAPRAGRYASTASTSRTGPSTRRSSVRGRPRRATTTTRPKPTATTRDSTQTRQVQHVRWEPASGEVEHFFDDEPVPGTQGVSHDLLAAGRAVPDQRAGPLRHRVTVGLRRRALPDRAARCGGGARRRR